MPLPEVTRTVAVQVQQALTEILGDRLSYLAVHGSSATGDIIPSYSDLDLYGVIDDGLRLETALALHRRIRVINPAPFSYLQPTFATTASPKALLVPGAFVTLIGTAPPSTAIQSEKTIRASGERWLESLPGLLASDVLDWAFVTADEQRRARLCLTRLKPAVRAVVVRAGGLPLSVWAAPWSHLVAALQDVDPALAEVVAQTLEAAHEKEGAPSSEVGSSALRALTMICNRHL